MPTCEVCYGEVRRSEAIEIDFENEEGLVESVYICFPCVKNDPEVVEDIATDLGGTICFPADCPEEIERLFD